MCFDFIKQKFETIFCFIKSFCFGFLIFNFHGYTTLFVFCYLINLKILNKSKIENFVFKQIQTNMPTFEMELQRHFIFVIHLINLSLISLYLSRID